MIPTQTPTHQNINASRWEPGRMSSSTMVRRMGCCPPNMVHETIRQPELLVSAVNAAHLAIPMLLQLAAGIQAYAAQRRLI